MKRTPGRYTAPGVLSTNPVQLAYFSLDGGKTNLGTFDPTSDSTDWISGTAPDDFDAHLPKGVVGPITPVDIEELGAIGFNVGAAAPTPPPPVTTPTPPTSTSEPTTPPPVTQIPPTPAPPMAFIVKDTTTDTEIDSNGTTYSGPVSYLKEQYVSPTQDSVNVNTTVPDTYIVTGNGNDGIDTSSGGGQNAIDAGGVSNFITGGAGNNTIFLADRNLGANIWTTITDFHAGDAVTLFGLTPGTHDQVRQAEVTRNNHVQTLLDMERNVIEGHVGSAIAKLIHVALRQQ